MVDAIDLASKESFQLVQFLHSAASNEYTDWSTDHQFSGKTYISTPDMEVKLPANDGLFGDQTCDIALPLIAGDDFLAEISNGQPHASTDVIVREVIRSTVTSANTTVNTTFRGRVGAVIRNYRGRNDKILLRCKSIKSRVSTVSMGIPCHHLCVNNLGDASCKVDMTVSDRKVNVVVSAIDGRKLTVVTNAIIEAKPDLFFHRGYLRIGGLNIGIQQWTDSAPLDFLLTRQAPASWIGEVVSVFAGCDKSIETCRSRYSNEDNFLGLGIAMPPYHPNFENAP